MNSCVDYGRPWSGRQKGLLSTVVARGFQRVNKRQHKKERWMTNELLAKIVIKNEMYVDWKTTPVTSEHFERVKL